MIFPKKNKKETKGLNNFVSNEVKSTKSIFANNNNKISLLINN